MAKKAAKKTATSKKSPAKKNVKKKAPAKKKASKTTKKSANPELKSMDETGRREKAADRRMEEAPVASERRKTTRRRQIDPTTCERDYTDREIEFMHAMDDYKRTSGRMFPTCSEILEVIEKLGYRKVDMPAEATEQDNGENSPLALPIVDNADVTDINTVV